MSVINYRELTPGIYRVFDNGVDRGEVYADGTEGVLMVEHWVLLDGYQAPTGGRVLKVTESAAGYTDLADFMAHMQARVDASGKPAQYVKATCQYTELPPNGQ